MCCPKNAFTKQQQDLSNRPRQRQENQTDDGTECQVKSTGLIQSDAQSNTAPVSHDGPEKLAHENMDVKMDKAVGIQDPKLMHNYKQLFLDTKEALDKAMTKNIEIESINVELKEVIHTLEQTIIDAQGANVMLMESIAQLKGENVELESKKGIHHCHTCGAIHDVVIYCSPECYQKQQ